VLWRQDTGSLSGTAHFVIKQKRKEIFKKVQLKEAVY
jgi:hypothetical protein